MATRADVRALAQVKPSRLFLMAQRQNVCAMGNDLSMVPEPVLPDQLLVPQGVKYHQAYGSFEGRSLTASEAMLCAGCCLL